MGVLAKPRSPGDKPGFFNLLNIAVDALSMWPPYYVRSILGPVSTWLPPQHPYSEFSMLDPWRLGRALKYIVDVSVPSISGAPPALLSMLLPPFLEDLFFVRTEVLHRPDYYDDYTSFPNEHWFFINGILTNGDVAHLNAACISWMFHRPVTLIQNGTDGALFDLYECALGKEWYQNTSNTEAARIAFPAIYDALKDPHKNKVVVICHSQGTIIMASVLRALQALGEALPDGSIVGGAPLSPSSAVLAAGETAGAVGLEAATGRPPVPYVFQDEMDIDLHDFKPLNEQEWAKLEIYFFATCANDIRYFRLHSGRLVPWLEHYGNDHDLVARLGMVAPHADKRAIHIEGPCYVRGAFGHLLNIDYLLPIAEQQKPGRKRGGTYLAYPFKLARQVLYPTAFQTPRLYDYINGGSPGEN